MITIRLMLAQYFASTIATSETGEVNNTLGYSFTLTLFISHQPSMVHDGRFIIGCRDGSSSK